MASFQTEINIQKRPLLDNEFDAQELINNSGSTQRIQLEKIAPARNPVPKRRANVKGRGSLASLIFQTPGSIFLEIFVRFFLLVVFWSTNGAEPFNRIIQPEESWLYRNPQTDSYVPTWSLWIMVFFVPFAVIFLHAIYHSKRFEVIPRERSPFKRKQSEIWTDIYASVMCVTLLMPLNGFVTNCVKLAVGRPRPDFLFRCWPQGPPSDIEDALSTFVNGQQVISCLGDDHTLREGRKSFPSGHSSFSFAVFGFIFFYLSGKMKTFSVLIKGQNKSYRMVASICILIVPTLIAISRTCDYHHHWQDVTVGSILGFALSRIVYGFYYPDLTSPDCDRPFIYTENYQEMNPILPLSQKQKLRSSLGGAGDEETIRAMTM